MLTFEGYSAWPRRRKGVRPVGHKSGWPNEAVLPGAHTYDALKFIDEAATGETVYQDWVNDEFEFPG